MKSSIKRSFSLVSEEMLQAYPSMKSDDDGFVVYQVTVDDTVVDITPEHLSGSYIADRVNDIKKERCVDDLRLVLSVPAYFSDEQVKLYQAGLCIANVNNYILIRDTESIAVAYSYYESLRHRFTVPKVVLFVGIGFYEAEAFVVRFSNDSFDILAYEHTSKVGAQLVDALILREVERNYSELKDESFPDWKDIPSVYSRIMSTVNDCRNHFTPGMSYYDESLPGMICGEDFSFYVDFEELERQIEQTELCACYRSMVSTCLDSIGDVKIDEVEPMNQNAFMRPFVEELNDFMKERGESISFCPAIEVLHSMLSWKSKTTSSSIR